MKKNEKGFTLIEIIAVIVILAILAIITVPLFSRYLRGFREDYYERLNENIRVSGQTFFTDNRNYRPEGLLESTIVQLGTLDDRNYIEEVEDYNGKSCSLESYVIVVKEGRDKYHYETCLKCPEDGYASESPYCSTDWMVNTNLKYELGDAPILYVYVNTPRSELKEKLKVKAWVVRYDSKGNVLARVNGEEDDSDNIPYIYPSNMDSVDTSKVGEYPVTYQYGEKTTQGKVIVYQNNSPMITIHKENNGTVTNYNDTNANDWGQKLIFDFQVNDQYFEEANTKLTSIQWYRDETKRWEDFCKSTDGSTCHTELTTEMNALVSFRIVTSNTNYSEIIRKTLRIDHTTPTVKFNVDGSMGLENWYTSDITFGFKSPDTKDNEGRIAEAISGIAKWGISTTNPTSNWNLSGLFNKTKITDTAVQTDDTNGTTWYAFVEDKAGNRAFTSLSVKKDTILPTCTLQATGTLPSGAPWYTSNVTISFSATSDSDGSGVSSYGLGSATGSKTATLTADNATGQLYTGHITDVAGHSNTCTLTVKKKENYTITYSNNSGTGCTTGTAKYGQAYGELCKPTRQYYTFDGWYTDSGLTNKVTSTTVVSAYDDHTLYAKWTRNKITVTYKPNGGSGSNQTQSCDQGGNCVLKAANTFSRTNYTFQNWTNGSTTYAAGSTQVFTADITLNASWKQNTPSATVRVTNSSSSICSEHSTPCRNAAGRGQSISGWVHMEVSNVSASVSGSNVSVTFYYAVYGGDSTTYTNYRYISIGTAGGSSTDGNYTEYATTYKTYALPCLCEGDAGNERWDGAGVKSSGWVTFSIPISSFSTGTTSLRVILKPYQRVDKSSFVNKFAFTSDEIVQVSK